MSKNRASASHSAPTEGFETIADDALSQATGGYIIQGGNAPQQQGYGWPGWWGAQPQYYTVQRGDNLTNIAKGNNESLNRLLTMNPQFQPNPNLIYPGQKVLTGYNYPSWYW